MALVTLLTSALDDFDGGAEGMNFNHLAISERLPGFETQNHLDKIFFSNIFSLKNEIDGNIFFCNFTMDISDHGLL